MTTFLVIDLAGPGCDHGKHPLICAKFTPNLLPDDKENKGKHPLDTYMEFKGRGRYKLAKHVCHYGHRLPVPLTFHSRSRPETINSAFEINPDANDGLNYAYDAVVRNKEERRKMHGNDCECCKEVSFHFPATRSALNRSYCSTIAPLAHYLPVSRHLFGVRLPPLRNPRPSCSHHL